MDSIYCTWSLLRWSIRKSHWTDGDSVYLLYFVSGPPTPLTLRISVTPTVASSWLCYHVSVNSSKLLPVRPICNGFSGLYGRSEPTFTYWCISFLLRTTSSVASVYSDEVVVSWVVGSSPIDSSLSGGLCDVKSVLGIGRMTSGER